jgi:hypothetical protein
VEYSINDQRISYKALGDRFWGEEHVLLDKAIDLTNETFGEDGFAIVPLFDPSIFIQFKKNTEALLRSLWSEAGLTMNESFLLTQYHLIASTKEAHLKAVDKTKLLTTEQFPVDIRLLEDRISEICKEKLEVKNPYDQQKVFHFRVIRPLTGDHNPLHRDVWLEDYSDCINLYIPIAGSNELSSLILLPGSHHWPESRIERTRGGAEINGVRYNVPAVTKIKGDYSVMRPNPQENEVLVFSPYLIHGGAVNLHKSETRISIEIRLWRK